MSHPILLITLFLFPLSLHAQEFLLGKWKIDPGKMEEVHKTLEPLIAKAIAEANTEDPAEKQKIREDFTTAFMNQRVTFSHSADGGWEQEIEFRGKKAKFPVTINRTESHKYHIYKDGKNTFIVYADGHFFRFVSAKDRIGFEVIRDKGEAAQPTPPATPAETPKP